jgi:hypothetical protein
LKEELAHNDTSSEIIERCDSLYKYKKSIEQRITALLNIKHPEIVMELNNVRRMEEDVRIAKEYIAKVRKRTKLLNKRLRFSLIELLILSKRRKFIEQMSDILQFKLKEIVPKYKVIVNNIKDNSFTNAWNSLNSLKDSLQSTEHLKSIAIVTQLKRRAKDLSKIIKSTVDSKLCETLCQFKKRDYDAICNYYKASSNTTTFFESIKEQSAIAIHKNSYNALKENVEGGVEKGITLKGLCMKVNMHNLVESLNEMYKVHTGIMYSHHLIISFHEKKCSLLKNKLEALDFHRTIKSSLINYRQSLWISLQQNLGDIFAVLKYRVMKLSIAELFEILVITTKYLKIGEDYSGIEATEYFYT